MVVSQVDLEEALLKQSECLTSVFNTQKQELMVKFDEIRDSLLGEIKNLKEENLAIRKDFDEVREIAKMNEGEILRLSSTINSLVDQNKLQAKQFSDISELLEDRTNRQLRSTLVFKGVPKHHSEKTWDDTRDVLASTVNSLLDISKEEASSLFERVHRGRDHEHGPGHIYCKVFNWNHSEKLKEDFLNLNKSKNSRIRCEQKYGPRTTNRRNLALVLRKKLKEEGEIVSGYLNFPARLMVKKMGEDKYTELKDFSKAEVIFTSSD